MSARKIETWHAAGLIDAETRTNLLAYEAEHARPLALWAVFGIGALAIGLGIISVVAANWEDVPGQVRLAIHMALVAGLLGAVLLREDAIAQTTPWALEALLFVASVLGLTFFGHLGQVYQTSSPLWEPIAMWLALFAPLLLITGRSWPTATLLIGAATLCVWEYYDTVAGSVFGPAREQVSFVWLAGVTSAPLLFAPLAAWLRGARSPISEAPRERPDFWRRLEQWALIYAVTGASFLAILASLDAFRSDDLGMLDAGSQFVRAAMAIIVGGLVVLARPGVSGHMSGAIFASAGLTAWLASSLSGIDVAAGLLFMALWVSVAGAALQAGWRAVFQLAVAVVAIRLIVLSFELASDLLLSGFGLILSGVMILVIAWAAYRVSLEYAPERSENTDTKDAL